MFRRIIYEKDFCVSAVCSYDGGDSGRMRIFRYSGFQQLVRFWQPVRSICGLQQHEECFEGVAARSVSELVKPDYVVIGEASLCNLKIGQRGRAEIVVETFGVPAHSANPEKGINAVYAMCRVVEAIHGLHSPEDPTLGKGILELTDIKSEPYPGASVVPS